MRSELSAERDDRTFNGTPLGSTHNGPSVCARRTPVLAAALASHDRPFCAARWRVRGTLQPKFTLPRVIVRSNTPKIDGLSLSLVEFGTARSMTETQPMPTRKVPLA